MSVSKSTETPQEQEPQQLSILSVLNPPTRVRGARSAVIISCLTRVAQIQGSGDGTDQLMEEKRVSGTVKYRNLRAEGCGLRVTRAAGAALDSKLVYSSRPLSGRPVSVQG